MLAIQCNIKSEASMECGLWIDLQLHVGCIWWKWSSWNKNMIKQLPLTLMLGFIYENNVCSWLDIHPFLKWIQKITAMEYH